MFLHAGVSLSELFLNDQEYFSSREEGGGDSLAHDTGTFTTSSGQELSSSQQTHLVAVAQTMWFLAMIVAQVVHSWTCRSYRQSLKETPFPRWAHWQSLAPLIVVGTALVVMPISGWMLGTARPILLDLGIGTIVLVVLIGGVSELRKLVLNRNSESSVLSRLLIW